MNAKLVAVILVGMVALAAGQYDRYSGGRFDRWGSNGGSWGLGSSRLDLGNRWGLGGSLGHHSRYRRSALGYGRYGHYENALYGSRLVNRLGGVIGGSWRLSGHRNSWNGY